MTLRKNNSDQHAEPAAERPRALSNMEIVGVVVQPLGGESRYVHTEDVAVKANELTPAPFYMGKVPRSDQHPHHYDPFVGRQE